MIDILYEDLKVIDWEQGEEDYGDFFIQQVGEFVEKNLNINIQNAITSAEDQDWAQLYNCIHNIKGSSGQ